MLIFLIEDNCNSVDFLGIMSEKRFHERVIETIAEVREGMHDFNFILIDLQITLPLLVVAADQMYWHVVVSLGKCA